MATIVSLVGFTGPGIGNISASPSRYDGGPADDLTSRAGALR
jgi:hypothetical protein